MTTNKRLCGRGTSNRRINLSIFVCCGSVVFVLFGLYERYFTPLQLLWDFTVKSFSIYRESLFCKSLVEIDLFYPVLFHLELKQKQDLHRARFTISAHLLAYLLMLVRTKHMEKKEPLFLLFVLFYFQWVASLSSETLGSLCCPGGRCSLSC